MNIKIRIKSMQHLILLIIDEFKVMVGEGKIWRRIIKNTTILPSF
jgi:hypothetical protein